MVRFRMHTATKFLSCRILCSSKLFDSKRIQRYNYGAFFFFSWEMYGAFTVLEPAWYCWVMLLKKVCPAEVRVLLFSDDLDGGWFAVGTLKRCFHV